MKVTIVGTGNMARGIATRAIDAGPLARAQALEALGFVHMTPQQALGTQFASAVKILP